MHGQNIDIGIGKQNNQKTISRTSRVATIGT